MVKNVYRKRGRKIPTSQTLLILDPDVADAAGASETDITTLADATLAAGDSLCVVCRNPTNGLTIDNGPLDMFATISCQFQTADTFTGNVIVGIYPCDANIKPILQTGATELELDPGDGSSAFFGDQVLMYGYIPYTALSAFGGAMTSENTLRAPVTTGLNNYAANLGTGIPAGSYYAIVVTLDNGLAGIVGGGVAFEFDAANPMSTGLDNLAGLQAFRSWDLSGAGTGWENATWADVNADAFDMYLMKLHNFTDMNWGKPTPASGTISTGIPGQFRAKNHNMVPVCAAGNVIDPRDIDTIKANGWPVDMFIEGFNVIAPDGLELSGGIHLYLNGDSTAAWWNGASEAQFASMADECQLFIDNNDTYKLYRINFKKVLHLSALNSTDALGIHVGQLDPDADYTESYLHVYLRGWEVASYYYNKY